MKLGAEFFSEDYRDRIEEERYISSDGITCFHLYRIDFREMRAKTLGVSYEKRSWAGNISQRDIGWTKVLSVHARLLWSRSKLDFEVKAPALSEEPTSAAVVDWKYKVVSPEIRGLDYIALTVAALEYGGSVTLPPVYSWHKPTLEDIQKARAVSLALGVFQKVELPPNINVAATIRAFFEQMKEGEDMDFSRPRLITPQGVTQLGGENIPTLLSIEGPK